VASTAEDALIVGTALIWLLCIPLGIIGGLTSIWFDPRLGQKIIQSAIVVGGPMFMLSLVFYAAFEENDETEADNQ